MYFGGFLIIVAVYFVAKLVNRYEKLILPEGAYRTESTYRTEGAYRNQVNPKPPILLVPEKSIEFVVNSKKIPCAFERYYYVKLNIALPVTYIDPASIERHYQRKLQDNKLDISTLNDVEAANRYFIDRLKYLSSLN